MHFEAQINIAAPPATVWKVLTDKAALQDGSFGILKIDGDIAPDGRIKLWSEVSPKRAFALRVSEFIGPTRMVWSGGMPFGLFVGTRTFTLEEDGAGTNFVMREEFRGPLSGPIGRSMPDLNPSFQKFAAALKANAEGAH